MNTRMFFLAAALAAPLCAGAAEFTSMHPEAAYPDNLPPMATSPGPFSPMVEAVQWKLRDLGFDAGPINGDFGAKTQAALAQFQLSVNLPASGMMDDATLAELGVRRPEPQS